MADLATAALVSLTSQPASLCQCGCGNLAPIAKENDRSQGRIKGQPMRFISGHNSRRPKVERFWGKVDRSGRADACWLWTGAKTGAGYGNILQVGGQMVGAHRVAWELTFGPIPPEKPHVLHNCPGGDNPACVNPAHLWVGTNDDNIRDKIAKGQQPRGERCGSARLTEAQIREIQWLGADIGLSQRAIAQRFGVTRPTISRILARHTWAHVKVEHVA